MIVIKPKNAFLKSLFFTEPKRSKQFVLQENSNESLKTNTDKTKKENGVNPPPAISSKLEDNLNYMKMRYSIPLNTDAEIREFELNMNEQSLNAFLVFFDGMVDRKSVNDNILYPLMIFSNLNTKGEVDLLTNITKHLLPSNQIQKSSDYNQIIRAINSGSCGLFIEGLEQALIIDAKGYDHRSIEKPSNEQTVRGPQESFIEVLRSNTSLIRKRLNDEDLIVEGFEIGERGKTLCSMLYIKDIANESLVNEVRRRLLGIKVDYLSDSGQMEHMIEDSSIIPVPQVLATERPDKAAYYLSQGRVCIIIDGASYVLVLPLTMIDFIQTSEDIYTRFPYANFLRFIRVIGILSGILLPALYIALTNYHQEMIPTSLLLAIQSTREKVPFPSAVEIFIMELSFELIREAGIRIPGIIGPTLGIIGALILGQAAVSANIVSPILIVIVSLTGLGSFTVPDYSFGYSVRIMRFVFILFALFAGFLGLTTGVLLYLLCLCQAKSFGVPIMAPYGPKADSKKSNFLFRHPAWDEELRPDFLNTKDSTKEPKISKQWDNPKGSEDDSNE